MLFCSSQFLVFFAVVFVVYWSLPWNRARVWFLLAASCYFYASWNEWLALLVFTSATLDFFLGLLIGGLSSPAARKGLVGVSVAANLGLLCYFKYANFFLDSLGHLLRRWGAEPSLPALKVVLPIGISFYTFEAISYIVDVYRGRATPERNWANFLLFILFFPHLVAGPIVRSRDFLPQLNRRQRFRWPRMQAGMLLFLLGLVKKFVIADRMALYADPVFADPLAYSAGAAWVALIAYAAQIYGDFSGYTDMALGTAQLLGYHLKVNFDMPYLACNIAEFWRRWHISLSSWLRDYLFIPLGGSRGGTLRTCRNLFVTMTLGGLWHGANWNFVIWGMIHGALLISHRLLNQLVDRWPAVSRIFQSVPARMAGVGGTFLCVSLCWVFFRAQTLMQAKYFFLKLRKTDWGGMPTPVPMAGFWLAVGLLIAGHALGATGWGRKIIDRTPPAALGMAYGLALGATLLLAPPTGQPFIYFQF